MYLVGVQPTPRRHGDLHHKEATERQICMCNSFASPAGQSTNAPRCVI